jgi:hypothetical protein
MEAGARHSSTCLRSDRDPDDRRASAVVPCSTHFSTTWRSRQRSCLPRIRNAQIERLKPNGGVHGEHRDRRSNRVDLVPRFACISASRRHCQFGLLPRSELRKRTKRLARAKPSQAFYIVTMYLSRGAWRTIPQLSAALVRSNQSDGGGVDQQRNVSSPLLDNATADTLSSQTRMKFNPGAAYEASLARLSIRRFGCVRACLSQRAI